MVAPARLSEAEGPLVDAAHFERQSEKRNERLKAEAASTTQGLEANARPTVLAGKEANWVETVKGR